MKDWQPKRSRAAWRTGAPDWVCDVFDDIREADRYTVFLTGPEWTGVIDPRVSFIICDDDGRCSLGDMLPHDFARYRRRNSKRRAAWMHLRPDIRAAIVAYINHC